MTGTFTWGLVVFCLKHCGSNSSSHPFVIVPGTFRRPWHCLASLHCTFLSPTVFKFHVFQWRLLHYGTESWQQRRQSDSLLNLLCWHSKPSKVSLSKKPGQVQCSPWITQVGVPGDLLWATKSFVGGSDQFLWLKRHLPCSVVLTETIAYLGFLNILKFWCLQSEKKKKYILLWRVKHFFWYSWWRSSVSVVCLCKAAGSSVMGQWDAVLQLWPGKTEAFLFISTPIMILDQKLLFTYWFLVSCITSTRLFTIVPFTVRFHTSPVTVLPQHHST